MASCSYPWSHFRGDVLRAHCRVRELDLNISKTADGKTRVNDGLAKTLLAAGKITAAQLAAYEDRLRAAFAVAGTFDHMTPMDIYRQAHMLRRDAFCLRELRVPFKADIMKQTVSGKEGLFLCRKSISICRTSAKRFSTSSISAVPIPFR